MDQLLLTLLVNAAKSRLGYETTSSEMSVGRAGCMAVSLPHAWAHQRDRPYLAAPSD